MIPSYVIDRVIDLCEIPPTHVRVTDIARTLSYVNRFNGRAGGYSVAQHAVFVSLLCPPKLAYECLHHDDTEAFIGDVIAPIKDQAPFIRELETDIRLQISGPLRLSWVEPSEVKTYDMLARQFETCLIQGRADLAMPGPEHYGTFTNLAAIVKFLGPKHPRAAEEMYMDRHLWLFPEGQP
jgi:hypothetical protein